MARQSRSTVSRGASAHANWLAGRITNRLKAPCPAAPQGLPGLPSVTALMPLQTNEGCHGYESEHEEDHKHDAGAASYVCVQATDQEVTRDAGRPQYDQQR